MITGQTVKNIYQGDGSNREFTITFEFTDSSQVKFKVNGEEITTNFALNTVAKTLTYPTVASELDPLTSADEIEIYRDTEITQDIEFNNGGPLNADMIEDGLDKLTMIAQELGARKTNLVAGNGIDIEGNVISLKGAKVMPDGTDVDTLTEEGTYIIKNPTSTSGMPMYSNYNINVNGKYAIVRVTDTGIKRASATYFVCQEMTLFLSYTGVDSVSEPKVYIRNLTDFQYTSKGWYSLGNDLVTIKKEASEAITLSVPTYSGTQVIVGAGYNTFVPSTGLSSLTILNYSNSYLGKTRIIFKAGSGFSLTVEGNLDMWIGTKPTTWTEGNIYMITLDAGVLKCEELSVN